MNVIRLFLTLLLLAGLTSCGGGGTQVAEGGIGGTGITMGRVTGFGSLFVNGIEFETDNADFIIEEMTSSLGEAEIQLGMVVRITGEHDGVTGIADTVTYHNELEGIVTINALDQNGLGDLTVMGQIVRVNADTVYYDKTQQGISISTLTANDVVEVSGFSDGAGTVYATRIELKSRGWSNDESLELKGIVTNLTATTFEIGSLTVDFSNASSLPDGMPQAGSYVEVKGDSFSDTGLFEADGIELEGDGNLVVADDGEEVKLEGIVTSGLSGNRFYLNGQQILISANTQYENGNITDITINREIEVEGFMNGNTLEAWIIEFESSEEAIEEMTGTLEAINVVDNNSGSLVLFGQTISVTYSTIMEDEWGDDQFFNLAALVPGQFLEVDLYTNEEGLLAAKLKRLTSLEVTEIEGYIQEINVAGDPDIIRVLNVSIDISQLTEFDSNVGDRVEIDGTYDADLGILFAQ